jgi:hypothetical protein
MDLSILVDPVNERCCLVDDDLGRAFGPVFTGEDCLAQVDLFVTLMGDELNTHPDPSWAIAKRAVAAMLSAESTPDDQPVPYTAPVMAAPGAGDLDVPTPATSPQIAPEPPEQPHDDDRPVPASVDVGGGAELLNQAAAATGRDPLTDVPIGAEQCWQCHGTGMNPETGEPGGCDICDGQGYIARALS